LRPIQILIAWLRSLIHLLWMGAAMVPYALLILLGALLGAGAQPLYRVAVSWLGLCIGGARLILGIRTRITGFDNLPQGVVTPAVLLVKHQSTFETFLLPTLMPHPLAYVFKKELLRIPFFGWGIGRLDMIHIDRTQRNTAFNKVVVQGKTLLAKGVWIIMFPEGTRVARGQVGQYKSGGTRLAIETGALVIPIAVTSARCWPRKAFIKYPGVVDVSIGPPIPSAGRQADELMREVQSWIEAEMQRLDPEAYRDGSPAPEAD
jgi:1-acyl-sn-glycerol-3-phosphate acyltransferase